MAVFGISTVSLLSPIAVEQNQCNAKVPMFVEDADMTATGLSEIEAKVWQSFQDYCGQNPSCSAIGGDLMAFYKEHWESCELGSVQGTTLGGTAVYQVGGFE